MSVVRLPDVNNNEENNNEEKNGLLDILPLSLEIWVVICSFLKDSDIVKILFTLSKQDFIMATDILRPRLPNTLCNLAILNQHKKINQALTAPSSYSFLREDDECMFQLLLQHLLLNQLNQVKALLATHPKFLEKRGRIKDHAGHVYTGTPFHIAFIMGNYLACEVMMSYFENSEEGWLKKTGGFYGSLKGNIKRPGYDFSVVVDAITQASYQDIKNLDENKIQDEISSSLLCDKIKEFRKKFLVCSMEETYFNPNHCFELIKAYKKIENQPQPWNDAQQEVFVQYVICYVQSFFPNHYSKAFNKGFDRYFNLSFSFNNLPNLETSSAWTKHPIPQQRLSILFKTLEKDKAMRAINLSKSFSSFIELYKKNQRVLRNLEKHINSNLGRCLKVI